MIKITVEDKEYNCPESWDELKWDSYINLLVLEENKEKFIVPLMYSQRFIEILCGVDEGVFDGLELDLMADLEPVIVKNFNPELLKNIVETTDHFIINGITYSFYSPNTIGRITLGEQGFIEMAKLNPNLSKYEYLKHELAVLIRPATKIITKEGEERWVLDKFNAEDVPFRAKILTENLSVKTLIMINNFFLAYNN